jgi:diguanylate cyclase (GGDEF)-like protein
VYDQTYRPDQRVTSFLQMAERPALVLVALVAGGILILWNAPFLADFAPGSWSDMSPLTAMGLLLAAGSLALSTPTSSTLAVRSGEIAALTVFALGTAILGADLTGASALAEGRILLSSPQTAAGLTLVGMCLSLMRMRSAPLNAADFVAMLLLALILFMAAGHLFGASFVSASDGRLFSTQTMFCLTLIGFVIGNRLALRGGLLSFLVHPGHGGRVARTILPFAVAAPFVAFGLVGYLDDSGILPASMTRSLIVPIVVLGTLAMVGRMGHRIYSLERSLRIQSVTDELTRTLNRRGFFTVADNVTKSALRQGTPLSLCFFDLDGLKRINDTLGHDVGSEVIERFAGLLKLTFRKSDVIARVGGDEFVVLAMGDSEDADRLVGRLAEQVALLNQQTPAERHIAYSIGFTAVDVSSDTGLQNAMARADGFMYEEKRRKRRDRSSMAEPADRPVRAVHVA